MFARKTWHGLLAWKVLVAIIVDPRTFYFHHGGFTGKNK
jgi:hypothetical protein